MCQMNSKYLLLKNNVYAFYVVQRYDYVQVNSFYVVQRYDYVQVKSHAMTVRSATNLPRVSPPT